MAKKRKVGGRGFEDTTLIERDLTALAAAGTLPLAYGLDEKVTELASLLTRGGKAPLIAGEAGVGKTAVVGELARRIAAGTAGEGLAGVRVLEVPLSGIFARTATPKGAAELFEELLEYLAGGSPTLVFLRDVGLLPGSSLVPVLLRALRAGRLRFIFECELRRANELLRSDETLGERLHLVVVAEPTAERARWILARVAEQLEAELGVPIAPSACDLALRLSVKFLLARRLPRKALELLKETAVEAAGAAKEQVTGEDVLARFCAATRLPRFMADDAEVLELDTVQAFFAARLLGQSDALAAVLRSVALLKAGLNDPRRPLGVFLFSGPTGVGKTHLAKLLAEYLFGAPDRLVRINMADFPDEGDENILFGSPWAQTLDGKRGELTRQLDGKVFSVLLLDEFEKAHPKCHDRFLQLFDEGQFINAAGETVACNNALIVATSNVGAEVYREAPVGFAASKTQEDLVVEVDRRIAAAFRPEFLNRFDAICHFHPLGKVEIRRIAQREVGRVLERDGIRARGLEVEVAPEVLDLLVDRGYSPTNGARFLQREIEKTLTSALAVEIARQQLPAGTPVKVVAHKGRVHAIAEPRHRREKTPTAQAALPAGAGTLQKRKLDRAALLREADALFGRAVAVAQAAGQAGLDARHKQLMAQSQLPGFWDDGEKATVTLRAFRAVELQLKELERLFEACQLARRRAREVKAEPQLAAAVRALEDAAREVQLFEARLKSGAGGDADEALLDIAAVGEGEAAEAWVRELLHVYTGWAARRDYEVKVVAEGEEPSRVVLQLSGPGVLGFLGGEKGLHRRLDGEQRVGAYVRVHRPHAPDGAARVETRELKRRAGRFAEKVGVEGSATHEGTGRAVRLWGTQSRESLEEVLGVLLEGQGAPGEEVRRYHLGRGARVEDPRTGQATPRVKDVMRGEIDVFIAAWLARPPEADGVGPGARA